MHETGRAEVVERLLTVDAAAAVCVVGPPWSGRTATLDEAAGIAERRDRTVHRIDGGRPGALDPAQLDPTGAAILVDDAHLLDDSFVVALESIVAHRETTDTWIVATHASGVLSPALASLRQGFDAVVELGPLDLDEVLRVHPLPEMAEPLHHWSGGWVGLVAAFDSDAQVGTVPGSLAIAVETRLAMLDSDARAVVTALAFGASADDESLARLSATADTDAALGRAAASITTHERLAPVIAAAVRSATEPAARRRMVDALLDLDRVDPVIEQVATWLAEHGERSTSGGRLYQRCGVACAVDRPTDADRWLRLAVECGVGDAALDQARAALGAGEPRAALDQLATVDDDSRLELMGHAFAHLGRRREAERWFRRAGSPYVDLVALDPPTPDSWRVDPVIEPHAIGLRRWAQGDAAGALDSLREAMREAEQLEPVRLRPDSPHAGAALAAVAVLDRAEAEEALRRADEARVGGTALARRHETLRAWVALRSGRWDDAEALLKNVDPDRLAPRDALLHRTTAAGLAVRSNRFDELADLLVEIARLLADVELTALDLPTLAEAAIAASRTHDGSLTGQMLALIDRCGGDASDVPLHRFHALWARLLVAMATNSPDDGVEAAGELAPPRSRRRPARTLRRGGAGVRRHLPRRGRPGSGDRRGGRARGDRAHPRGRPAARRGRSAIARGGSDPRSAQGVTDPPVVAPTGRSERRRGLERPRAGGRPRGRRRSHPQGGRGGAVHLGEDGRAPCRQDPPEARGGQPRRDAREPPRLPRRGLSVPQHVQSSPS